MEEVKQRLESLELALAMELEEIDVSYPRLIEEFVEIHKNLELE